MKEWLRLGVFLPALVCALSAGAQEQPPPSPPSERSPAEEAVLAAERAAVAAAEAAEAAADAAKAAAKLVGTPEGEPPSEPSPPEKPPEPPAPPPWSGAASVGLISLTGNAESLTGSASAAVDYRSTNWVLAFRASAQYGQSRPSGASEVQILALNAATTIRLDRKFSERYSGFFQASADLDHLKSVLFRGGGDAGISVLWLDDKKGDLQLRLLRMDLSVRGARELRYQFFPTRADVPDVTIVAPRLGLGYRYALNEYVSFSEDVEVITNVYGEVRTLVNSVSRVSVRLTKTFSVSAGFELRFDSNPAPGRVKADTTLTLGLDVKL